MLEVSSGLREVASPIQPSLIRPQLGNIALPPHSDSSVGIVGNGYSLAPSNLTGNWFYIYLQWETPENIKDLWQYSIIPAHPSSHYFPESQYSRAKARRLDIYMYMCVYMYVK